MFDIGFWELALIGILALVVLGPKRLPEAARAAGYWLGRIRNFIANARSELDQQLQGGDMEEIRRLKEELDETRRYMQQVADKTGSDMAESLADIDPGYKTKNSIGLNGDTSELQSARASRKRVVKKKVVKTAKRATSTAGGKSVNKASRKVAGKSPKKAVTKKTGKKKVSKKASRKKST